MSSSATIAHSFIPVLAALSGAHPRRAVPRRPIQLCGAPPPRNAAKDAAENEFFAESIDRADENAYTGRTE